MGRFSILGSRTENVAGTIDVEGNFGIVILKGQYGGFGSRTIPAIQVIKALESNPPEIAVAEGIIVSYDSSSRDLIKVISTKIVDFFAVFGRDELLKFLRDSKK